MEKSPLSMLLLFFNLVCVQSVIQLMNTRFIYLFCIMIKDFHFFSRVIIDFETVTFYVLGPINVFIDQTEQLKAIISCRIDQP